MKTICKNCKEEFSSKRSDKKFCTNTCRSIAWKLRHTKTRIGLAINQAVSRLPLIKVEHGKLFNQIKTEKRVEDFFILCHSMLWSTRDFHEGEKNKLKKLINQHFEGGCDVDDTFKNLVEKVVLTKRYVLEKPYRFIAEPNDWLNIQYYNGLSSANKWHEALQAQRKESPDFGESLSIFADAILLYAEQRNIIDINFYRQLFISMKAWDLLQWYMNAVVHYQFINY